MQVATLVLASAFVAMNGCGPARHFTEAAAVGGAGGSGTGGRSISGGTAAAGLAGQKFMEPMASGGTVSGGRGTLSAGGAAGDGPAEDTGGTMVGSDGGVTTNGGVVASGGQFVASGGFVAAGGAAGDAKGGTSGMAACAAGAHACSGDTLLSCDATGQWSRPGVACDYVCRNNACTGECKPDQHSCKGSTLLTCSADGRWPATGMICAAGYTCNATQGACVCSLTTCADGRCIDTTNDAANCGACGKVCPGNCQVGKCQCVTATSANLVANGGVDTALTGWSTPSSDVAVTRASLDAASCTSSGSLLLNDTSDVVNGYVFGAVTACIPVTAGKAYNIGAWAHVPSQTPQPGALVQVVWYSDNSCVNGTPSLSLASVVLEARDSYDSWQYLHADDVVAPAGAASMVLGLSVTRPNAGARTSQKAYFDVVYFTPSPGGF